MFNSLKYAKELEKVGVSREQAEIHLQIISEIMESNLATQQDVKDLKQTMGFGFANLEHRIIQSEQRMTIKLGTIVSIAVAVAVAVAKLVI
jgi:hypothetical protein